MCWLHASKLRVSQQKFWHSHAMHTFSDMKKKKHRIAWIWTDCDCAGWLCVPLHNTHQFTQNRQQWNFYFFTRLNVNKLYEMNSCTSAHDQNKSDVISKPNMNREKLVKTKQPVLFSTHFFTVFFFFFFVNGFVRCNCRLPLSVIRWRNPR